MATANASTEPVVGQIVGDIELQKNGACLMPVARLKHWAAVLQKDHPRASHPVVYQMLGGMAVEFAKKKAEASIQLFALATLGLPPPQSIALAKQAGLTEQAQKAAAKLRDDLPNAGTGGGLAAPKPRPKRR